MAEADEEKLISTLTWSTRVYSLAQFVQNFNLPQVVRIEVGYYGKDDTTTIGSRQVVTLHALETREKLVGEDSQGKPIAIPLRCPLKVHVYPLPMTCSYDKIVTEQMKFICPKIKYVLSYPEASFANEERRREDLLSAVRPARFGSVLRIEEIDDEKRCVRFEDVATKHEKTFTFGCSTIFEPLLDGIEYTLKEVKKIFGLPARIRFVGREASVGGNAGGGKPIKSMCSLGKVTLLHGITDTLVIASDVENAICLKLSKDLPLEVRAAEGLIREEESYANIVETFNRRYLGGHLTDSNERLDEHEDLNTVTHHVERLGHFQELKGPELPPRNVRADHPPPEHPPKRLPSGSLKKSTPPTSLSSKPWKQADPSTSSCSQGNDIYEGDCDDTRIQYVEPTPNYDSIYTDVKDNEYETVDHKKEAAGASRRVPSPASYNRSPSPKYDIATVISLIPNDLSCLSVKGVGNLLKDLHMECYRSTFENELVDGEMLRSLDRISLESLNVSDFHIMKLMKIQEGWRPNVQQ